jgi:hypothetical protein
MHQIKKGNILDAEILNTVEITKNVSDNLYNEK